MSILNEILIAKGIEVSQLRKNFDISDFESSPFFKKKCFSLSDKIRANRNISVIAEIKKASPSRGLLKHDFNPVEIADYYMKSEVTAISVLTDKKYFHGDIEFIRQIAECKTKPLLRKDFIIDEYQVYEAKAIGSDLILLIAEALSAERIKELSRLAYSLGMEVLLEFHSEDEIGKIDFNINKLIGINNRNLITFETNISTTIEMKKLLPDEVIIVSESGINSEKDIIILKESGIDAILVGEFLMKSSNLEENISQILNWCRVES